MLSLAAMVGAVPCSYMAHLLRRWSRVTGGDKDADADKPVPSGVKGVYMYGGVGCGKTMLMDLLVAAAPKQFFLRRVHFHDFMLEVHQMLQALSGEQVRCCECSVQRCSDHLPRERLTMVCHPCSHSSRMLCV